MAETFSIQKLKQKAETFCAYQERCHKELIAKLKSFHATTNEIDEIVVYLIENNFLNEERFAKSFARGKFSYKKWGKNRITQELKQREISTFLINLALKEIDPADYETTFEDLSNKIWEQTKEKNILKKRKKCCDFLLRKGYESDKIYSKIKELEGLEK